MIKINKLDIFKEIKAFNVLLDNEMFEKHNMFENFSRLYEDLIQNILSHTCLDKIRNTQKEIIYLFIIDNKEYLKCIGDTRTYFFNVLWALERICEKQIQKRIFVLYKDKKNKILHTYSLKIGDLTFFDIDSKNVIQEFKKNFKLEFEDNGAAVNAVNHILKYSNKAILWRND